MAGFPSRFFMVAFLLFWEGSGEYVALGVWLMAGIIGGAAFCRRS